MKPRYRKAVATRRANKAQMDYYREVTEPAYRRLNVIMNALLQGKKVSMRWNPTRDTGAKLMKGAQYGDLVGFERGFLLKVLPDGYKSPKVWHVSFWEPLID